MKDEIVIDGRALFSSVTIGVRIPRLFGLRIWLATKLFALAGLVAGCNVSVEVDDES